MEFAALYFLEYFTDTSLQELEEDEINPQIITSRHLLFQATTES